MYLTKLESRKYFQTTPRTTTTATASSSRTTTYTRPLQKNIVLLRGSVRLGLYCFGHGVLFCYPIDMTFCILT